MVVPRPQPGESLKVSVLGSRGQQHPRDRPESDLFTGVCPGPAGLAQNRQMLPQCQLDLSILTGCEPGRLGKRG